MTRVLILLIITLLTLAGFQNCGSMDAFPGDSKTTPSMGGGDGYGGKVFVELAPTNSKCNSNDPNGNPYKARINLQSNDNPVLVKEDCQSVLPQSVAVVSDPGNPNQIFYQGRVFTRAPDFFDYGGFETTLDQLTIWGTGFQHIAEAAHSGLKGLRLHKTAMWIYPENLPLLNPSRKYRISFWAKVATYSPGTAALTYPFFEMFSSRTVSAGGIRTDIRKVHIDIKNQSWTRYEVDIEPVGPVFDYEFMVSSSWDTNNVVDIDDFTIEELPCAGNCDLPNLSASGYPWAADLGRPAIQNLFPQGALEQASDFPAGTFTSFPFVTGTFTPNARYAGTNGFRLNSHVSMSRHPNASPALPVLTAGKKYRLSVWARLVSVSSVLADPYPKLIIQGGSATGSGFERSERDGFGFKFQIDSTAWKRYEVVLEPRAYPGEFYYYDLIFQSIASGGGFSGVADFDEIKIEEI